MSGAAFYDANIRHAMGTAGRTSPAAPYKYFLLTLEAFFILPVYHPLVPFVKACALQSTEINFQENYYNIAQVSEQGRLTG